LTFKILNFIFPPLQTIKLYESGFFYLLFSIYTQVMSSEILSVLEYMEKEKGISREDMIFTISDAIRNAALKGVNTGQEIKIEINPKNGALHAWTLLKVSDPVSDPALEIDLKKASTLTENPQLGDIVEQEIDPAYLGRIAAQTARQAIMQRIRQFEKEHIYDDYKDVVGDIVSGIVRRRERGDLIIDLGKTEAILSPKERVPGEDYAPGERIRCLLLHIENASRGPELMLSRSTPKLVQRLFELEVTEIADGTVTIESMAREAGYRTKICVKSHDPKVDPVGACVGARGARVKSIVRELGGEKIDIIRHFPDPKRMLEEAIKPAQPHNIRIDEEQRRIFFEVEDSDLSIAIGRRGQNAKLTSKILGWKLDIGKVNKGEKRPEDQMKGWINEMKKTFGFSTEIAEQIVKSGINSPSAFQGVSANDLADIGFDPEAAHEIMKLVTAHFDKV